MKCPYCGKEMDEGYIYNGKGDLCWIPKGDKPGVFINHPQENQIQLMRWKIFGFSGAKVKVMRCSQCCIEIIDEKDCQVE